MHSPAQANSELRDAVQEELRLLLAAGRLMLVYLPGFSEPVNLPDLPLALAAAGSHRQATSQRSPTGLRPDMKLKLAAPLFQKRQRLAAPTARRNACYWRRVLEALGGKRLCDITADDLWAYQEARQVAAGAVTINHEISQLKQLLTAVKLWPRLRDSYQRLRERPSNVGRALSPAQEKQLFAAAGRKDEWEVAYLVALLAKNALLSPSEIYGLQLEDVTLGERLLRVKSGKNKFRPRSVPLNRDALAAVERLLERAREKAGASQPRHYLLPYGGRSGRRFDPTQPTRGCRSAWRSLTRAVGLAGLRIKDLRHHGTTVLDEHGVSDRVTKQLLGHSPNSRILETYSHPRIQAKRAAVRLLEKKRGRSSACGKLSQKTA